MAPRTYSERGAALLVVMVAVAVLTALAAELAYDARVSLRIAANARDELQATQLAKGGVALSRLLLSFQQELDESIPKLPGKAVPRPQLWKLVTPLGSELTSRLFGAAAGPPLGEPPSSDAQATFEATIEDEGTKVNVQLEALAQTGTLLGAQVQALYQLICDPRWDVLFDREDENGVRVSRQDLLVYLRDWVDEDEVTSSMAAAFSPVGCVMLAAQSPFEAGFGDENFPYDRGEDRYRAKNARMDSLDELYMVAGVGDAFMAAFGDRLTVYLPRDAKRNVNETEPARLVTLARIMAEPPTQPALYEPLFATKLHKLVLERTFGGVLSLSPWELGQLVEAAGVTVNANLLAEGPNNPFTDRSSVYHVRSTGHAGDVAKSLDAVVRFDKPVPGQPVSTPGRLVHWREE